MHLWHLSTIPPFWVEYFAERLLKGVSWNMFFFSKFKIPFHTFVIRQTQIIPNDSQWRILETEAFLKFDSCFSTESER